MNPPLLAVVLLLAPAAFAGVQRIELIPARDTTIYSDEGVSGLLNQANGAGEHLFAGETGVDYQDYRRALLFFDLASLPAGARITQASLSLSISRTPPGAVLNSFQLHRVTSGWGEGASDAPGEEGTGAAPAVGDATWQHGFFGTVAWNSLGGDFLASPSAVSAAGALDTVLGFAGAGLAQDVQGWLDGAPNHGWMVIGQETADPAVYGTVRRFFSRSVGIEDGAPVLRLDYEVVPEPATGGLLLLGLAGLRACFRGPNAKG